MGLGFLMRWRVAFLFRVSHAARRIIAVRSPFALASPLDSFVSSTFHLLSTPTRAPWSTLVGRGRPYPRPRRDRSPGRHDRAQVPAVLSPIWGHESRCDACWKVPTRVIDPFLFRLRTPTCMCASDSAV